MKDAQPESAARETLHAFLMRLTPEQRLEGLAPEDRLAGLAPDHAVLVLPDDALRALAPTYVATLPDEVQAAVRARLTSHAPRSAASPRRILKDLDLVLHAFDRGLIWLRATDPEARNRAMDALDPHPDAVFAEERRRRFDAEAELGRTLLEARLASVDPVEALQQVPDATLRDLADDYFVTLPTPVQAAVRARLAR